MSFVYKQYILHVIVAVILFVLAVIVYDLKFFSWIKKYWFYNRSYYSYLSSILYLIGFSILFMSLLDLRGPVIETKGAIPDQKTVILIDTSASMLSEDVRPSRFQKAILIARHFVKSAIGHQVSVVIFSDDQKRLIPFTNDLELLDARLAGLNELNINNGGSNISQAILESVGYLKEESQDAKRVHGNLLIITDAEENEGLQLEKLPDDISVAVVGVGTVQGGRVPMRGGEGRFMGFKTFRGEEVVTKLDEKFIKKIGAYSSRFKYWIANSYTLPTDEVVNFLRSMHKQKFSQGKMKTRPVYARRLTVPAMIILFFAFALKNMRSFRVVVSLLFFISFLSVNESVAQTATKELSAEQKKAHEEIETLLGKMKNGDLDKNGKLELAEKLVKSGNQDLAEKIYNENLDINLKKESNEDVFNFTTTNMANHKIKNAVFAYRDSNLDKLSANEKKLLKQNFLKAITDKKNKEDKQNQDKQDQDKQDQEKKDQNNQDKNNQDKKGDDKKDQQNQKDQNNKNEQGKDQKKDQNQGKGDSKPDKKDFNNLKSKKDKDKKNEGQKDDKDKKQDEQPSQGNDSKVESLEEKEDRLRKEAKTKKVPGMIQQLMDDDKTLQGQMLDTSTAKRAQGKKDW